MAPCCWQRSFVVHHWPPATTSRQRSRPRFALPCTSAFRISRSSPFTSRSCPGFDTGDELLYTNDGTLIFAGRVIDTKNKEDLTAARWNELHAIDFNSLPFDLAIKTVRGDGSRKLAVFADPLCPYCRQLEQEMQGLNNVTIYTFLYPLETIHPGASVKAVDIWCAKDRSATWSKWMLQQTAPPDTRCTGAPIDKLQALGQKIRIDSTPTMFTVDGKRTRGAIKHNEIEQLLANTHK
jgi:thiol:disulfide interchange protein DsbC